MGSGHAFDLGGAEGVEAVHQGDADVDLGCLAVGIPQCDPFAEGFQIPHLGFDPAADMISGPPFPDRPAEAPGCPQDVVAGQGGRVIFFPEAAVSADGNDPVILPFLTGRGRRTYAAIFSFIAGVMPPMPMFGRSLLYVHSHCVAKCWASSMLLMMYWSSHSCLTVRL